MGDFSHKQPPESWILQQYLLIKPHVFFDFSRPLRDIRNVWNWALVCCVHSNGMNFCRTEVLKWCWQVLRWTTWYSICREAFPEATHAMQFIGLVRDVRLIMRGRQQNWFLKIQNPILLKNSKWGWWEKSLWLCQMSPQKRNTKFSFERFRASLNLSWGWLSNPSFHIRSLYMYSAKLACTSSKEVSTSHS